MEPLDERTYIDARAQEVLAKLLDPEDRQVLRVYITNRAEVVASKRNFRVFAKPFGIVLGVLLGVLGPLAYFAAQSSQGVSVDLCIPEIVTPTPSCPACEVCEECSVPPPVEWDYVRSGEGTHWEDLDLRWTDDQGECVQFSNGTVTCVPIFTPPPRPPAPPEPTQDSVPAPAPSVPVEQQ